MHGWMNRLCGERSHLFGIGRRSIAGAHECVRGGGKLRQRRPFAFALADEAMKLVRGRRRGLVGDGSAMVVLSNLR